MKACLVSVVALLAVTCDALRLNKSSKLSGRAATLEQMMYWEPAVNDVPVRDDAGYVLFSNDAGGLNNIRIGWEYSGIIARRSGRTLVLPPAAPMYLLDFGPQEKYGKGMVARRPPNFSNGAKTRVEDLLNLKQLKGSIPTLTWEEFAKKTGLTFEQAKKQARKRSFCKSQKDMQNDLDATKDKMIFLDGNDRQPFECGEWAALGGPQSQLKKTFTDPDWALLRHGFVWHQDAFDIASKVVNFLGFGQYNALHARYGDIQFKETKEEVPAIFAKWPSLRDGSKLYVASDAPEKFTTSAEVFVWDDFFSDKTGKLLSSEKEKYSQERWFKLTGLAEELICTYSKIFVGSQLSTFSGHIQRMRIHVDVPNKVPLYHTRDGRNYQDKTSETKKAFQKKAKDQGDIFMQLN